MAQIQELQDKVNSLSDSREICDPETASSSGLSHVPSQPMRVPEESLAAILACSLTRFPSLLRQNISYTPIVWSAHGRPHQDTLTVLRSLNKFIAGKRNFVSAEVESQSLHSSITLAVWKRIPSCWPLAAVPTPLDPDP